MIFNCGSLIKIIPSLIKIIQNFGSNKHNQRDIDFEIKMNPDMIL